MIEDCGHDKWDCYECGWEKNIRIDSYICKTCGTISDMKQHLDQEMFNQVILDGSTFYDWGEWKTGEPYEYQRNGIIIEIPVVKEETVYRKCLPRR